MKNNFVVVFITLTIAYLAGQAFADSQTQSFQMSVHLPAIVGVNVDENGQSLTDKVSSASTSNSAAQITQDIRDNETVLVKTIVSE